MMQSLETGQCVWVVTDQNIFGFRVENLGKNEVRDLKSIPMQPPFDFHLNLPKRGLRPFIFESELFLAGGSLDSSPHSSNKIYQLSYAGGTTLDIAEAGTIPEPPTLLYDCCVANIQGDVHLLVHDAMTEDRKMGFWVLRSGSGSGSGSKQWHPLTLPPSLRKYGMDPDKHVGWGSVRYSLWFSFIWKDKLFLMAPRLPAKGKVTLKELYVFYVYDPQKDPKDDPWQQIKHPFPFIEREYYPAMVAVSSLGDAGNCNVALTWSSGRLPSYEFGFLLEVKIHALLADNQGNCAREQCLDELSGATPPFIFHSDVNVNFVDLGKGKVCILIGGYTVVDEISPPRPILCVLVLKLGFVQGEEEQWGQRFLSVDVPVNQVYDMLPYIEKDGNPVEVPRSSFVFSFLGLGKRMPLKHSNSQGNFN